MSSSSATLPPHAPTPLREDASLIALIGVAHMISHFSQLLLPPLFPWLKEAFGVSYTQLGFLMTVFFVVSCGVQFASGFWVDRYGPRPVLFAGLAALSVAAFGFSISTSYWGLAVFAAVAGMGNGVFHPVDYTLINRRVSAPRLGHAYSVHGITGNLGWAIAPALMVPLAVAYSWRVPLAVAGAIAAGVLLLLWVNRARLHLAPVRSSPSSATASAQSHGLGFMRIPAVWMCFGFFFVFAAMLTIIQAYAPEAARKLHGVPMALAAACLTIYMLSSAAGMVLGGFLISDPARGEQVVVVSFAVAAGVALTVALLPVPALWVPVLFGVMGFAAGTASPSRDLLVKRTTPEGASGRVYGVVYSGLDIGQAVAPLVFGLLMDWQRYSAVWLGVALFQSLMIVSALNMRKVRREPVPA